MRLQEKLIGDFGKYTMKNGEVVDIVAVERFVMLQYLDLRSNDQIVSIELFHSTITLLQCDSPFLEKIITPSKDVEMVVQCNISAPINPFDYPYLEFRLS